MDQSTVWWQSKTLWVAAIAFVATVLQSIYGMAIPPEYQGYALAIIMALLRLITKSAITATKEHEQEITDKL